MTIGVYCIQNNNNGKRYIGKSIDIERRISAHKCNACKDTQEKKKINSYFYNAVQKHGWTSFTVLIVETLNEQDDELLASRELYWMDYYQTNDLSKGYNLRRDSASGMEVHDTTRRLQSESNKGEDNPNYGNKWSQEMKDNMSIIKKQQHSDGVIYDDDWRSKQGKTSKQFWKDNPDVKTNMSKKLSKIKQKFYYLQLTNDAVIIKVWNSIYEITTSNPSYKWQNIHSVCNGHKKRIYGYKWQKVLKHG